MNKVEDFIPILLDTLSQGKDFIMPVNGTSMLPFIHKSHRVILTSPTDLKKNDIVFYQRENGQYVLHRIYKVKKDYYVMMGDNQTFEEAPIYKHQIISKAKAVIKKNKTHNLKGLMYSLYLLFWNCKLVRRLLFPITRRINYEK